MFSTKHGQIMAKNVAEMLRCKNEWDKYKKKDTAYNSRIQSAEL